MEARDTEAAQAELAAKNKMGVMPVGKLLVNMSVPMMLSMLVQALYNVVDSIFVARISEDALAAVGLVFPVQTLMAAVAVGTGIGVNSLLSRRLGEKNVEGASKAATNGLFLALMNWAVFALVGLFGAGLYMTAFTGGKGEIHAMGETYMLICTVGSLGIFMQIMMERLLQSTGRATLSMTSQMVGAIINIILDPIMIFGLVGFPAMGVAGAALATVIGQWCGMLVGIWFNFAKNKEITLKLRGFRPSGKTIQHIYRVGLPSIVMQSIGSVMSFSLNKILVGFGTPPVSVFNIYFKLQSFIFMPVFGLNSGLIAITAFNYGAQNRRRIERVVRLSVMAAVTIMTVGTVIFWTLPEALLSLFDAGEEMMSIGVSALRIISLCFPLAGVSIALSGVFQGMGQGSYSLWMSVIRQLLFLIPLAWVLARLFGLPALWAAFPIAEVAGIVVAVVLYRRLRAGKIAPLPDGAP
ncbi:MATE family efflux transporter [Ruminococcaceae bacterium OttesenSCG-928-A11]|nr:MATE family efflux transporter [Ruminococcaceae bacterium OttesenSCG-928-A11]